MYAFHLKQPTLDTLLGSNLIPKIQNVTQQVFEMWKPVS